MRRPGQPALFIKPPKMAHGDAGRMADFSARVGLPLVPWQRDFLNRLEAASMNKWFHEIVHEMEQEGRQ